MKTLIGGAVAALLGVIGLAVWWKPFLTLLAGVIPIMLVLGGGLALYLGFDELKDTWKKDEGIDSSVGEKSVDEYRKEIDDLRKEIDALKK
jgi:hypothetical protein